MNTRLRIRPCADLASHPYGYCGKQGQSHTQIDFHDFELWQTGLFCLWPSGMIVLALLRKGLPESEKVNRVERAA
jgi:hypothetical protein